MAERRRDEQCADLMRSDVVATKTRADQDSPATFRKAGGRAYFTMDAGPHVKVLVEPSAAPELELELRKLEGVSSVLRSLAGPDAYWVDE